MCERETKTGLNPGPLTLQFSAGQMEKACFMTSCTFRLRTWII